MHSAAPDPPPPQPLLENLCLFPGTVRLAFISMILNLFNITLKFLTEIKTKIEKSAKELFNYFLL